MSTQRLVSTERVLSDSAQRKLKSRSVKVSGMFALKLVVLEGLNLGSQHPVCVQDV